MRKILIAWLLVAACSSAQQPRGPSDGVRKLGIESYVTRATIAHLEIDGLDAQGQVLAKLELTVGPFVMKEDDRGAVDGRQLKVTVLGQTATHESEGRNPLDLPMPFDPGIATVLGDPSVAAMFEGWDVRFAPRDATVTDPSQLPEQPYATSCEAGPFNSLSSTPFGGCGSCTHQPGPSCPDFISCMQFDRGGGEVGEFRCCPSAGVIASRTCTSAFSTSSCGATGQNGCATCWTATLSSDTCFVTGSGGTCTAKWCGF
jgi:hypothetical protein